MFRHTTHIIITTLVLLGLLTASCREDEFIVPAEYDLIPVPVDPGASPAGLYLLNEGNMGSNKASIDFVDFRNAYYCRNIYPERNPSVIKELGDVGNDIRIYGSKLYAVINCSHKVEVMDAATGVRIGQIDIPNCRYIRFCGDDAYVSSYVSPVVSDPAAPKGAVYKVDTTTLQIKDRITVGYQPEEMEIIGDRMYVANSGGYRAPDYDYTLSVIDLNTFRQIRQIPVGINLHRVRKDNYGKLWITSRGNMKDIPSRLMVAAVNPASGQLEVTDTLDIPCNEMTVCGDMLYFYSSQWSDAEAANKVSFGVIDTRTLEKISDNFITDGTEKNISVPYGIIAEPVSGDIYITDAKNYVSSGMLHCYDRYGRRKWSMRTGDIPAHLEFYRR